MLLLAMGFLALSALPAMAQESDSPPPTTGVTVIQGADIEVAPVEGTVTLEAAQTPEAMLAEIKKLAEEAIFTTNNLWMMVATAMVFIMHLGFATVESGLTRSKNTVNVLFKNTLIPGIGLLTYAFVGFNLMYPGGDYAGKIFGFSGVGLTLPDNGLTGEYYNNSYTYWTDFLFQGMFAATAATIVSGAVAERIKLGSFLLFSTLFVAISYPITGMWQWGGGWLKAMDTPFIDFAGSTLVHSVGGWGALVGVIILGPRAGRYNKDGSVNAIPGHSMPLAVIGVFLLWFGWFGFNGGSVLSAAPGAVSLVLVTTSLAAAAGSVGAMLASWFIARKPDLSMTLNGILAGLVGITAGADLMSPMQAIIIGAIAGVVVVFAVLMFDRLKIDDPVGAISVHLVCGIWGTLAVGLFGSAAGKDQLVSQFIGVLAVGAFTAVFAAVVFLAIKATLGLRVSLAEEAEGLDLGEHDMSAYPDFQRTFIKSYHAREI